MKTTKKKVSKKTLEVKAVEVLDVREFIRVDMDDIRRLLWELREGPAVIGMKRDMLVKQVEAHINLFDEQAVIETYAKETGWVEEMNTTAALWLVDRAKKAGDEIADLAHPEFGHMGRLEEEIHELKKEVEWLTFYKREVYQCLGAGVDDVNKELRDAYVKEKGIGGVPEKLRKEYLDYENDHKED